MFLVNNRAKFERQVLDLPMDWLHVEPLGGFVPLLLVRRPSICEVVNDHDGSILEVFRGLQNGLDPFDFQLFRKQAALLGDFQNREHSIRVWRNRFLRVQLDHTPPCDAVRFWDSKKTFFVVPKELPETMETKAMRSLLRRISGRYMEWDSGD